MLKFECLQKVFGSLKVCAGKLKVAVGDAIILCSVLAGMVQFFNCSSFIVVHCLFMFMVVLC